MTIDTVFDVASLTKVVATMPAVLALWPKTGASISTPRWGAISRSSPAPRFAR